MGLSSPHMHAFIRSIQQRSECESATEPPDLRGNGKQKGSGRSSILHLPQLQNDTINTYYTNHRVEQQTANV